MDQQRFDTLTRTLATGTTRRRVLGPTDSSGSLVQSVGSYAKGGKLDVRIDGVASDWTAVDC